MLFYEKNTNRSSHAIKPGFHPKQSTQRTCVSFAKQRQETQLSLGLSTVLVVSDLQGHPRSTIFISSERAYAISYYWSIATSALYRTVYRPWRTTDDNRTISSSVTKVRSAITQEKKRFLFLHCGLYVGLDVNES